ncbi:MAG: hypothetical protein ACYC26_08745 [Phycisphaerales bacterium]
MSHGTDKLDGQLDALARDAQAGGAKRAEKEDVMGVEFADQVQKMLDEAKTDLGMDGGGAGGAPPAEAGGPALAGALLAGALLPGAQDELIGQIDKMLAEQADQTLEGKFESVDELLAEEGSPPPPPPPPPEAEVTEVAEALVAEGEAEALKQAGSADAAGQGAAMSLKAAAVGAELDADESGGEADDAQMQSIEEMFPEEDDPSAALEESGVTERAEEPVVVATKPRRPMWQQVLLGMNRPLQGLSPTWRDAAGCVGIGGVLMAGTWIGFTLGGLIVGASGLTLSVAGVYLVCRKLFLC